jgi:uncharacterized protein YggT (Ycf19 family)
MTQTTPTVTESRHEVHPGAVAPGPAPIQDPNAGNGVALRGTPIRPAAAPAVVERNSGISTSPGYRAVQTVWLLAALVESIIGLRVLFHAVGANRETIVVRFIDYISAPLLAPFSGIVEDYRLGNGGMLEISSLITMAVYLVAAFIVAKAVRIVTAPRTRAPI